MSSTYLLSASGTWLDIAANETSCPHHHLTLQHAGQVMVHVISPVSVT